MNHDIVKTNGKYRCTVCGRNWKNKPASSCPGAWRYAWKAALENLKTRGQLEKLGLKPGGPKRGVVGTAEWPLYDQAEAIPLTLEEIEGKREERRKKRYRTCKKCTREVRKEKWNSTFEVCLDCLPEVLEARRVAREQKRKEEEQLFAAFLAKNRDAAICIARDWLQLGNQAVILDTETTGLESAEAIEIAIVGMDGTALLDQRVKPQGNISDGAYQVHQISMEMLAGCPTWDQVYPAVRELLEGKHVIIYNADFDTGVLSYSGQLYQLPELEYCWHCAMTVYAKYFGEWNDYYGSFKWQRLQGGDHSALGDCRATLALIKQMAKSKLSTEE